MCRVTATAPSVRPKLTFPSVSRFMSKKGAHLSDFMVESVNTEHKHTYKRHIKDYNNKHVPNCYCCCSGSSLKVLRENGRKRKGEMQRERTFRTAYTIITNTYTHKRNKRIITNDFTFVEMATTTQQEMFIVITLPKYKSSENYISRSKEDGTKKEARNCFAPKTPKNYNKNKNKHEHDQKRTKIMYNTQYRFYRHVPKGNLYAILVCSSASFVRMYLVGRCARSQTNVYVSI